MDIGWSSTEDLLCVQQDGTVLTYDIFGKFHGRFSMGQVSKLLLLLVLSVQVQFCENKTTFALP